MRDNELEEGEAYFFHDDYDEKIDPDRDFSYIDKKIENVLGHYQKDFMGGLSAESLGARFGGYGSFLPMQQRSLSVLSEERNQSHVSSKSPQPPGQSRPNPIGATNISLPVKPHTGSSVNGTKAVSESGALSMNNQPKLQDPSKSACNKQQKEPMPQYSKQNSLKLRVKMTAENALPYDKSVIYSGLGLDISPSSSPEDSPSDSDNDLPGVQVKTESPSYIVEIMTTLPLSNDELLSPLHDSLLLLSVKGNSYANSCSEGKKETSNGRKSSKVKYSSKDRKIKKELRKERKSKEAHQSVSHVELMTGNRDIPAKAAVLSLNGEENVSIAAVGAVNVNSLSGRSRVNKNDSSVSQGELSLDRKNEAECRDDDENSKFQKQQGSVKDRVKERVLITMGSKPDKVYRKGYEMEETASKDKEAGLLAMNDEHDGTYEEMKDCTTPKLSKQKTCVKVMPSSQVEAGVFGGKKKSWEIQTDGRCSEEPARESVVVGPSSAEIGVGKGNIPFKGKKGDSDLRKEMKKEYKVATNGGSNKKAKEASLKEFEMGVGEREISVSPNKQKERKKEIAEGVVPNITDGLIGSSSEGNMCVNLAPAEIVPHDNWVQCDKCHKWRLLPSGMGPESLPKVWKCSMLTWLPGKNKCSVSEEETNAVYQPPGPTLLQNNQLAYPDVCPFVGASGHVGISSHTSNIDAIASGSKRHDLLKTDLDVARRSGFQDPIPLKKDQLLSTESGSRYLKKLPRDPNAARKSGDVKPSKLERKREADFEAYGVVSKKMKRAHSGVSTIEAKGDLGPLEMAQDYGKRPLKSSHVKLKDKTQNSAIPKNSEIKDSGKKRKLKDQVESTTLEYDPGRVQHQMKNSVSGKNSALEPREERKERKSNLQGREGSADKTNSRTLSDGGNHKKSLQECHNIRNSTEKALHLGLSDNATTTSSSSKVSCKRKAKASEVKRSPIGSISSSPFRLSKCDSDRGTSKMSASYKESVDLSSSKQLKSNLSRSCGADANADNNSLRNKSTGKRPRAHITEDCKDTSYKLDHMIEDSGAFASQHSLPLGDQVVKSSNRLCVDEANSKRMKVHDPPNGGEKGTSYRPYGVPENEQRTNVDNASLRHTQSTAQSPDVELPLKKGSLHRAAKTALKEATNLKHSANRLKISGSAIESTELFFQAALKFLHGASLLEPDNNESGRGGEMASIDVYSTTATLCEYCGREYERGNNLASAALAYKCMEVAYMRAVYCNDVVVSRDRTELQMTIRVAPQVESPSSSASDVDNLNNQAVAATETMKDGHSALDHRAHLISAQCRPSFSRLLNFTEDINRAMEASRRSQMAFEGASPILTQTGKHGGISSIKAVLDFSFHDVEGFLHLVRLAMEALSTTT